MFRTDLEGQPAIEALACYVTDTQRGTNIEKNGVVINTSEHVLAALVGLDIDNIIIEIDAPEPPIMDGSSKFFMSKPLRKRVSKSKMQNGKCMR